MTRYAVLCPGQGGQHAALFERMHGRPAAQPWLEAARATLGRDLDALAADVPAAQANRNAQPLIVAASVAAWQVLAPDLPPPELFAGYSVGELSAYGCAGSFDASELLSIASQRAGLMSAAAPALAGLLAVRGGSLELVQRLCGETGAHVAIVNGADRHVVGGTRAALQRFASQAAQARLVLTKLPVDVPAHTPHLQAAAQAFRSALEASKLHAPLRPVLAGVDGHEVTGRADAIDALAQQIAAPLQWHRCMTHLVEHGCHVFLELPPGRALSQMLREQFENVEARAVEDFKTLDGVRSWLLRQLES